MKTRTFNSIDDVHKTWNDETWIRYNQILESLPTGLNLTKEQENQLFPKIPDYVIVGDNIYSIELDTHLEKQHGSVDSSSFCSVELTKIDDESIIDQYLNTPSRKMKLLEEKLNNKYTFLSDLNAKFVIDYHDVYRDTQVSLKRKDGQTLIIDTYKKSTESEMDKWLQSIQDNIIFMKQVNELLNESKLKISSPLRMYSYSWSMHGQYQHNGREYTININNRNGKVYLDVKYTFTSDDYTIDLTDTIQMRCETDHSMECSLTNYKEKSIEDNIQQNIDEMISELEDAIVKYL